MNLNLPTLAMARFRYRLNMMRVWFACRMRKRRANTCGAARHPIVVFPPAPKSNAISTRSAVKYLNSNQRQLACSRLHVASTVASLSHTHTASDRSTEDGQELLLSAHVADVANYVHCKQRRPALPHTVTGTGAWGETVGPSPLYGAVRTASRLGTQGG